jgi:hypothetical protein
MTRIDAYRDEASDRLGHVLRQFRTGDRPRRVAEVPGRDLATPRLIARPLELCIVRAKTWTSGRHRKAVRGNAYVKANRDGGPTLLEHRLIACHETCEATMHGVPQGYSFFVGLLHIEVDGLLKVDFIDIATSVT